MSLEGNEGMGAWGRGRGEGVYEKREFFFTVCLNIILYHFLLVFGQNYFGDGCERMYA